jgi:NAD+ dependent glucose-6-phosphate dehydrogenase
MSKIAVTGATGFIGKSLCTDLRKDNTVVEIDIAGVERPIDVCDLDAFRQAIEGCDAVIHLARVSNIRGIPSTSWKELGPNLEATYNAFEAARLVGCPQVIFASSNHAVGMYEIKGAPEIYQPKNGTLLTSETPLRGDSLYGVWKAYGEVLGRYYSDEYGLKVACVRIGNARAKSTTSADEIVAEARERALARGAKWSSDDEARLRVRSGAVYTSHRDIIGLIRAILKSDVPFGAVFSVSDNANRFWDLEGARTLYGFWPTDGIKG